MPRACTPSSAARSCEGRTLIAFGGARAAACRAPRRKARHQPTSGAGRRRRRLGRRLPARADRLRSGAQPLRAARRPFDAGLVNGCSPRCATEAEAVVRPARRRGEARRAAAAPTCAIAARATRSLVDAARGPFTAAVARRAAASASRRAIARCSAGVIPGARCRGHDLDPARRAPAPSRPAIAPSAAVAARRASRGHALAMKPSLSRPDAARTCTTCRSIIAPPHARQRRCRARPSSPRTRPRPSCRRASPPRSIRSGAIRLTAR